MFQTFKSSMFFAAIVALVFMGTFFTATAHAQTVTIFGWALNGTRTIVQSNSSHTQFPVYIPGFATEQVCLDAKAVEEGVTFPGTKDARGSIVIPANKTYFVGTCYKARFFVVPDITLVP